MKRLVEGPLLEQLVEASLPLCDSEPTVVSCPAHTCILPFCLQLEKVSAFLGPCDRPQPTCLIPSTPFPEVCSLVTSAETLRALSHGRDTAGGLRVQFPSRRCGITRCQIAGGAFPPAPTSASVPLQGPSHVSTLPGALPNPIVSRQIEELFQLVSLVFDHLLPFPSTSQRLVSQGPRGPQM